MIRKYRSRDLDSILAVWSEASEVAHPFLTAAFMESEKKAIGQVHIPNARTWVYEADGAVEGFMSLVGNEIGALFVRPSKHRGGIGGALLETASKEHRTLEVEVFQANAIGRSFYHRHGFAPISQYTHQASGQLMLRLQYTRDKVR